MVNKANISLSTNDKIGIISNLSTMLEAGIAILEAINSLIDESKSNSRVVLETIRDDLMQGKRVYTSLAVFPRTFDKVTINIVKAAEEAGTLDVTLRDLKENIRKEAEFSDKVKSAMVYPLFIAFVFAGVLFVVLVVVIPKIAIVFGQLKFDLPLPTRILIFVSDLMLKNTLWFIGGLVFIVTSLVVLFKTQRRLMVNALFSLPVISNLIKEIDLTRFTRSLYLLLSSGIPITTALDLAGEVVVRNDLLKIISKAKSMVNSGQRLSEGFKGSKGVIPTIVVKLIEAGEKTGTLDKSMKDVSEYLDYQVSGTLKTLTALLEPVMLVVVGIAVGGMMMSIIAPIYGLIGQVGAR